MYWYFPLVPGLILLIMGLMGLAGCGLFFPKKFKNQGWSSFCRKEYSIHYIVIGLICGAMGFCCWYFSFTLFESLLWTGILLIPTISDLRMLNSKYRALL